MQNLEIAKIFFDMADLLEIKDIKWKPRAYRKAARTIQYMVPDIAEIYKKGGIKKLKGIPGVGEGLAEKIEEYIKSGKVKEYEKLKSKAPKGILQIMKIPGIGPQKAKKLYSRLKIKSIKGLESAAKKHKLLQIESFKEKTEKNILRGIDLVKKSQGRFILGEILSIAEQLHDNIKNISGVDNVDIAGSIRRAKETVRDIDILITSKAPRLVMDAFTKFKDIKSVIAKGNTKSTVILANGIQVDLRIIKPESYGAALQYFTGSKDHDVALRKLAMSKGYKLNEYGLFKKNNNQKIAGRFEKKIYNKLGLKFIPPEIRENSGEIASARKKLPKLMQLSDIKGDLHSHTKYSDGENTIQEMALAARALGYKYLGITDHSPSEPIVHGLKPNELLKRNKEIMKINKKIKGIRLLAGSEVDILKDGSLDYKDEVLKKLDIVIVSVHTNFKMPKAKMTQRVIRAMSNEHANILGHPTSRLLLKREPILLDMDKIFEAAKDYNVALEINSQPQRLDLNAFNIREGLKKGVKFVINSDAHNTGHFDYMHLGVLTARRGWCEKKDILNTKNFKFLSKSLKLNS
ncbi:MAG: DNA polymerase/3'-5' exonuclease PolX [Nanoarchaeota archaeon]|nr:DNA polymerase/3'-5' exonuclease PolX [Nanoarchaeota archaeon]